MANILVIDDDTSFSRMVCRMVSRMGHDCRAASTLNEGMEMLAHDSFDVLFLDVHMPDGSGLEALQDIRAADLAPEVIIVTGAGDPDGAELAIKNGAWDYVEKSASLDSLKLPLLRALQYREEKRTRHSLAKLKREGIIGSSPQIQQSLERVAQIADSHAPVHITGETGTGKELFARAVHANSPRADKDFIVVDCAAMTETLVESMLFGHKKGAFTGADRDRVGLVQQAHGGTLFLDEIGELPMGLQKSLLRVLQEKRFRPLGSKVEVTSDFRLVSATNRDLDRLVQQGKFRQDLLYRITSFVLELSPLRERAPDIRELAVYHMTNLCQSYGLAAKGFAPEFMETLTQYHWPGNVRELVNTMEWVLAIARPEPVLFPQHLPENIRISVARKKTTLREDSPDTPAAPRPGATFPRLKDLRQTMIEDLERHYIRDVLEYCDGDVQQVCSVAGLSRSRVYALMQKYSIQLGSSSGTLHDEE
jgi:two-component system NtrC family response regulator